MKFGASLFPTDYSIGPAAAAIAAERAGLESLWFPEHTHMPTNTRWLLGGDVVPRDYKSTLDPFVAFGAAASVTTTIRLGTGICLIPQRDPIILAKEVASLDVISGGRVILGVGAGWNAPETRNHGVEFARRFRVMRERLEAMKAIWTEDEAEYHGETVDFGPVWSWPKPVQKPHPPIVFGSGTLPRNFDRILALGGGWMPIAATLSFDDLAAGIAELARRAAQLGKPKPEVTVFGVPTDPAGIRRYEEIGVDRAVWGLTSEGPEPALQLIERYGRAISSYQ
ncbi:MAG: LLM class F420-dependent oxidoreductase [Dehalococcoidia bacterium]|nr:LLM class F420-dependent oxidoreductase [Dehalococcoidia bacterium]